MVTPLQLQPDAVRPLKRSEYEQLVELGAFEDERVELLRGMIVEMSPQKAGHSYAIRQLYRLLVVQLRRRAEVQAQLPVASTDDSEPEPDVAVLPPGDYRTAHPAEAWLVIEVAEFSLRKDREVKAPLYAEQGVPEYWIVNLAKRVVEVHAKPRRGKYSKRKLVHVGERLVFERFPDVTIAVADILP